MESGRALYLVERKAESVPEIEATLRLHIAMSWSLSSHACLLSVFDVVGKDSSPSKRLRSTCAPGNGNERQTGDLVVDECRSTARRNSVNELESVEGAGTDGAERGS